METISSRSFPRAGLLGNPSDGYFGKTLSFAFAEYSVDLTMTESSKLRFIPSEVDDAMFDSPEALVRDLRLFGYYGGIRMLKAVAKLFFEYCFERDIALPRRNFSVEYRTNIPRLVGLSGSSAICSAMLKALCKFYEVAIVDTESATPQSSRFLPLNYAPTICLEAEKLELGINCGFQDRVVQMYNGLVFMDFEKSFVEANKRGRYERLPVANGGRDLNLYLAFDPNRAEESGLAHRKVKRLFEAQQADVVAAMSEFAEFAQAGRDLLMVPTLDDAGRARLAELINANFDLRDRIFNVAEANRNMVMVARSAGASAKFAGSGGAIVGTYADEAQFVRLAAALANIGCTTFKPTMAFSDEDSVVSTGTWRNS